VGGLGFGGARLGGGLGCCCCDLGRGDFGDGGDGAEVWVEDEVFDEVVGRVILRGGGVGVAAVGVAAVGVAAGGGAADVAAAVGAAGVSGGGARIAREVGAGDEQAVEEMAGALGVELVGGNAVEDLGEGELDAGAVVDGGQLELGLGGMDSAMARGGAAGGMVLIAEGFSAQSGRAATAARGVDVTAEEALDGGLCGFGGCGCVGHEVPLLRGGGIPP
jgi:hypothetical protein